MEELLPRCILYPIDKRGVQSADWIFRLSDNKDSIMESFWKIFHDTSEKNYLDIAEIEKFLKENNDFNKENEIEYLYVIIAYIYAKFKMLQL